MLEISVIKTERVDTLDDSPVCKQIKTIKNDTENMSETRESNGD